MLTQQCNWCAQDFPRGRSPSRYCSTNCRSFAWRADHPEKVINQHATYYAEHREELALRHAAWRRAHPEKTLAYTVAWQAANPEKALATANRRRAREQDALCASHPICGIGNLRAMTAALRPHECWMCGKVIPPGMLNTREWPLEHIVPINRGGVHCIDNLAWACRPCNQWKADRLIEELYAVIT